MKPEKGVPMTPSRLFRALCCLLLLSFPVAAAEKPYRTDAPEQVVAAGSIGGSWFIITTAFFELFSKNIEGLRYNIVPGGSISNPIAIDQGMATVAMGYTSMLHAASRGEPPFRGKIEGLRAIANLNVPSVLHAIFLEDTDITGYGQIAEREYGLELDSGPRGTGGELAASRVLEAYGAPYDQIKDWGGSVTHSSYREALDRMKDGHIEAFINDDIVGQPLFVDIALARDVRFLPMEQAMIDRMVAEYGYSPAVIPAGTYRGQSEDIPSTAQHFAFHTSEDLPEDLVYAMTKLIFTNKEALVAAHPLFQGLDPAVGPHGMPIPLHAGAERYYREIGVLE